MFLFAFTSKGSKTVGKKLDGVMKEFCSRRKRIKVVGRDFSSVLNIEDDAINRLISSQIPLEIIELVEMDDGGNSY